MLKYLTKWTIYHTVPIYNLNWIKSKSFYDKILGDRSITLVDVGARAGSAEELKPLEGHINYIGFDADEEEVERLKSVQTKYKSCKYIAYFVSKCSEDIEFNIYKKPGDSSVYSFSEAFSRWYQEKDENPVQKVVKLKADSLDNLISEDVDIIKLDTQGNEFEILTGAQRCFDNALMAEIEVEFIQMYKGQKLAFSVMEKMSSFGFDLLYLNRVQASSKPFKGFSRGQLIFGDALFGVSRERALELSNEKKIKYCALLINYGHIDFAYDIFKSSPELQSSSTELNLFFSQVNREPSKISRLIKFTVDKVVFVMLFLRKTNGIRYDSDRSWPIR